MTEEVVIRQNNIFETEFWTVDPHQPDSGRFQATGHLHAMTPYTLFLAGLGSCTAIVLHTYAQNHGLSLDEVEITLQYGRDFQEDCENCETIDRYEEQIKQEIVLTGDLSDRERERLFAVSHHCPIHKMLKQGVEVRAELGQAQKLPG